MQTYNGRIEINNKVINWETTFEQSVKFKCIRCGLSCIGTDVQVSEREIERISKVSNKDFIEEYLTPFGNKRKHLKKIGNKCIFLDAGLNCTIYNDRPMLCREYPFKVLFTNTNNAVIDLTYHCGCIIKKEFTRENLIDFGALVMEHYINAPEDCEDLNLFNQIITNVRNNLDSSLGVKKCTEYIIDKLISPIELCSLIVNFQKAREGIKILNSNNYDTCIKSAISMPYLETDWNGFMQRFFVRISEQKNNIIGLEPTRLKKYELTIKDNKCDFRYYYSDELISIEFEKIERKIITKQGHVLLKEFLNKFWDRAVTSYDFYLAMDSIKKKLGKYPPSMIVQLDAMRFVLHCLEFFLHIISGKNKHEDINEEDVNETIVLLDGAFLTITSGILPR